MSSFETVQVGTTTTAAELKELAQRARDEHLARKAVPGEAVVNPYGTGVQSLSLYSDGRVVEENKTTSFIAGRSQVDDAQFGILATVRSPAGGVLSRAPRANDLVMIDGVTTTCEVACAMGYLRATDSGSYVEGPLGKR